MCDRFFPDINHKASKLLGHAKEIITVDVYGDNRNIIAEEVLELLEYMADVMPVEDDMDNVLEDIIDVDSYFGEDWCA